MRTTPRGSWILLAGIVVATLAILVLRGRPLALSPRTEEGRIRIVSLSPSVTEMLFALGVGNSLVAVTDYCDFPPEAQRIERVGGLGKPNVERLLALAPDLVVTAGSLRGDLVRTLRDSGIPVLEVKARNVDEVFHALRQIGREVEKSQRAEELVAEMLDELNTVAERFRDVPAESRPRVFVELWADPLTTAGGDSFLDDVISRAGGINVAHELPQQHSHISAEKVIDWNPDVIVVAHMARGGEGASQLAQRIGWSEIAAVKKGRIVCDIPPDLLLRPGPRLVDGIKALAQRLQDMKRQTGAASDQVGRTCP